MRLGRLRGMRRLSAPALGLAIVGASLLSFMPAQAQTPTPPKFVNIKGFAHGSALHVTALQSGGTRLADVDAAFGSATVNGTSAGLGTPLLNEYNFNYNCPPLKDDPKACAPALAAKHSYARGSGLEAGLGVPVPSGADPNQ